MARQKAKRKASRPRHTRTIPIQLTKRSNKDAIVAKRIARVDVVISLSAFIPVIVSLFDLPNIVNKSRWLILFSITVCILGGLIARRVLGVEHTLLQPNPYSSNPIEARKRGVWFLSLSVFVNIAAWMPILYAWGYIDRLASHLPGKEQLGNKLSLGVAFGLGAILSGVLGNAAYDLLKYIFRKMLEGKE
jgi:hypothetical protein